MKEKGFWQMKFGKLKVCLYKVTMSIFTAKTTKYSHLVTPKYMSYSQFNSIFLHSYFKQINIRQCLPSFRK